ncbi:MAG TPA: hypothetical protein ENJ82_00075 [Bacteroidetes bacterium]|nr:hypothetical protein [Bacteroidota bacterium]
MIVNAQLEKIETSEYKRVIGRIRGQEAGPTVLAIGGMHGNEPSGVLALQQIISRLEVHKSHFKGEFIALTGNIRALEMGRRFIDQDLNRMWKLQSDLATLAATPDCYEAKEMQELQTIVDEAIATRRGPLVFLDLHTTSAESPPFLLIGDTMRNRRFVRDLQLPVILGLEEQLNGPFLSYLNTLGHISMAFEAGQHDADVSIENHFSLLWLIFVKAGCLNAEDIPDFAANREWIASCTDSALKNFFEVRHRQVIREDEHFKMLPGYHNFQEIKAFEFLANNRHGKVRSPEKGRIFMPLYQEQGDDGFFVVRPIAKFWLRVSAIMRMLGIDKLLPWLPGFRQNPQQPGMLEVNSRIVRWFGPQILHLLGYRRRSRRLGKLLFIKRRFDRKGPLPIDKFPK